MHDALFAAGDDELDDARLVKLASGVGLDGPRLLLGASDPELARKLAIDQQLAQDLELDGTPTLFVNGRELAGAVSFAVLDAFVREELAAAQRIVRGGTPIERIEHLLCGE
jgi:protein-disulfide isomerase